MPREVITTTREHRLAEAHITLLGAWRTVTGAMTRVDAANTSLLLDCGIAQGRDACDWRRWRRPATSTPSS